jgi:hydrogenase nickel incorporation protein HypA/HybF
MHEVSLIEDVIALVEQERTRQAFTRVNRIRLEVGLLGDAEPEALRFCFNAVAVGTIAEGSRLEIKTVAGEGWCERCRRTAPMDERFAACPECVGVQLRLTAGDAFRLAEMEVE